MQVHLENSQSLLTDFRQTTPPKFVRKQLIITCKLKRETGNFLILDLFYYWL